MVVKIFTAKFFKKGSVQTLLLARVAGLMDGAHFRVGPDMPVNGAGRQSRFCRALAQAPSGDVGRCLGCHEAF